MYMMKIAYKRLIDLGLAVKETIHGSRKGIEDTAVSLLPQIALLFANFVIAILIARGLGPDGMGKYALILSVSGLATALSDLGIGQTAIRFAARAAAIGDTEQQHSVLRWAFRLRMILILLITLLAFAVIPYIAANLWHAGTLISLMRLSLMTSVFIAISSVPTIYFQSLKNFKMNTIVSIGQTFILLLGVILITCLNKWSLESLVIINLIVTAISSLIFLSIVPKTIIISKADYQGSLSIILKQFIRAPVQKLKVPKSLDNHNIDNFAFLMVVTSIIVALIMRSDVWLMGVFLDKHTIGVYSVASRFASPLAMGLAALNTALWPRASALMAIKNARDLLKNTYRLCTMAAIISVGYSIFVPLFLPYVFGYGYESGVLLAQLLCLRYSLAFLIAPIGIIGYSFGFINSYWKMNIIQLIIVVLINIIFLPRIGPISSAIALIVNELVGAVIIGIMTIRKLKSCNMDVQHAISTK